MKKIFLSCLVAFFLLICISSSQAEESYNLITAIEIRGSQHVSQKIIFNNLSNNISDVFDTIAINEDVRSLASLGYFKNVEVSFEAYKKGTKVIYTVFENPFIRRITFSGNTIYQDKALLSSMKLKENELLNRSFLRKDIDTIQSKYHTGGYVLAKIVAVQENIENETLNINISEGVVQGITFEGINEKGKPIKLSTKDYVITREIKTKAGSVFNEKTLKKDIKNIYNLGYYGNIMPALQPGSDNNSVIIILYIPERRTSTVNFGGGFGEREGWFGFVDLSVNNIFGTAQNILLKGQSGQEISTYQFKYYNPWFWPDRLGEKTSLTYRLWNTMGRDIYLTLQDELHLGWDMAIGKELRDNFRSSFSFGSESVSPRSGASFEAYISTFVGLSFSYDTRDVWMNPSSGSYHTISLKQGWKATGAATTNYTKYGIDLNRFNPMQEKLVFAWHIGTALGVGDLPLGELYWAGGPNTIRGYAIADIKKGSRKVITNWEMRYTFNETFQGVFFFDWGNAWYSGFPDFSDFIAGWGPGVRVTTPLGPIRLDYGMGTSRSFGEGILHFSIGQAF
ncbi:MAG: BamA/TamA family outer membrane protein [Candidatus Saganbacteria bacterium]|nr:BamA/TamA family outer membrane protein [Candidatus Saganbacteria bacterium]